MQNNKQPIRIDSAVSRLDDSQWSVRVPKGASGFFVSGAGFLCAKSPVLRVVVDTALEELGIPASVKILECGDDSVKLVAA